MTDAANTEVAIWRTRHRGEVYRALSDAKIEFAILDPMSGGGFTILGMSDDVIVNVRDAIVAKSVAGEFLMDAPQPIQWVEPDFFDWNNRDEDDAWNKAEEAFAAFFKARLAHVPEGSDSFVWVDEARKIADTDTVSFEFAPSDFDTEGGDFSFIARTGYFALEGSVFPEPGWFHAQLDDHNGHGLKGLIRWLEAETQAFLNAPSIVLDGAHRRPRKVA